MVRSRIAVVALSVVLVAGTYWFWRGTVGDSPGFIDIGVPPSRFLDVQRPGRGDWEPFVEPSTGYTGYRLSRGARRIVTVRMHDLNDEGETRSEHDVSPGGYVVTGDQRVRIRSGAT